MEFGSDCVYLYDYLEYEHISEDEYEAGMVVSESDSDEEEEHAVRGTKSKQKKRKSVPASRVPPSANKSAAEKKLAKLRAQKTPGNWRERELIVGGFEDEAPKQQQRRERRADTNIVSINFQELIAPCDMHTGDPVHCTSCDAILSSVSKVIPEGENKIWQCEFCDGRNELDIEPEEIPKTSDVTFMMEPSLSTASSGPSGLDESLVIFCIDISGSMCVTTEVPGKINLRGSTNLHRLQSMNTDRSDQFLPNQRRNVTYISRLQAAQAAVDHQLQEMTKQHPNRRVALIAFNNEVNVIGDGSTEAVTIAGDKLTNVEELEKIGSELGMPQSVAGSRKCLGEKLFSLEEGGATALGPALVIASTMAAQHAGSKVIICTDGKANVGLGRLDLDGDDNDREVEFYSSIGQKALDKGVSISVISIKGTDCKLVYLGKVADTTGGQVNIVDPLKLTQEFSTILADSIIATNVVATFILHKELYFFYEDTEESKVIRNVGNVSASTEITFEYGVRCQKKKEQAIPKESPKEGQDTHMESKQDPTENKEKSEASGGSEKNIETDKSEEGAGPSKVLEPSANTSGPALKKAESSKQRPKEVPFQLQIKYTDTDGAVALRVLTQLKPTTKDRREAERRMNIDVLGKHTAHTTAKLALDGQYTQSRGRALMNQRLAWRYTNTSEEGVREKTKYKKFFGKIKSVDHYMNRQQQQERSSHGRTYSDSEDDECEALCEVADAPVAAASSTKSAPSLLTKMFRGGKKKLKMRSSECTDDGANIMYNMMKGKRFLEGSDEEK